MCPGFHFCCENKKDEKVIPCRGHGEKLSLNDCHDSEFSFASTLQLCLRLQLPIFMQQGMEGQMHSKSQDTS